MPTRLSIIDKDLSRSTSFMEENDYDVSPKF